MRKRAPSKFIYGSAKVAQFSKSTRKIATNNTKKHTTFIVWVGLTWLFRARLQQSESFASQKLEISTLSIEDTLL